MAKKKTNAEYMTDTFMSAINVEENKCGIYDGHIHVGY